MDKIRLTIGKNLQRLRKEKQLTLQDLSDITGVSKSMLGEIERSVTNPTITVLWKIADGLKIPFSTLISEECSDVTLVKKEDMETFVEKDEYSVCSIFKFDQNKKFEVYHLDFSPNSRHDSSGHNKGVEEYVLVYEGELVIEVNSEKLSLKTGDSLLFKAENSHSYANIQNTSAKAYSIIYYETVAF